MPDKLTLLSVATPEVFVVAVPTLVPFSLKLMDLPLTPELSDVLVSVAVNVVVPPYVPVAVATARDVQLEIETEG